MFSFVRELAAQMNVYQDVDRYIRIELNIDPECARAQTALGEYHKAGIGILACSVLVRFVIF